MSKYSENIPNSIFDAIGWFFDEIPTGATVLDVGCSTGYYGSYIKSHKKSKVYGIEISEDKEQAKRVLDGVYTFDLDADWPKNIYEHKYDVIFLGDVIEHIKNPEEVLGKLHGLMGDNSRVYISTPNIAHISIRLELLGGGFEYEDLGILDNTHLKYFTLYSLTELAHKTNFDIIKISSSESDYPKEVILDILNKYGLKPEKKFWELVSDPTARAYQYRLVLQKAKGGNFKSLPPIPLKPEKYKDDFITNLNNEILKYKNELLLSQKKYSNLQKEYLKISSNLSKVLESKAYKTSLKLQKAKQKTSRFVRGQK